MEKQNSPSPHNLHITVNRTLMGTLCEGVTALILLLAWVWSILVILQPCALCEGPNPLVATQITSHDMTQMIFLNILGTSVCLYMLRGAYRPLEKIHLPMRLTSAAQLVVLVHYARAMGIILSVLFLCIALADTSVRLCTVGGIGCVVCVACALIASVGCITLAYRRRNRAFRTYWTF